MALSHADLFYIEIIISQTEKAFLIAQEGFLISLVRCKLYFQRSL